MDETILIDYNHALQRIRELQIYEPLGPYEYTCPVCTIHEVPIAEMRSCYNCNDLMCPKCIIKLKCADEGCIYTIFCSEKCKEHSGIKTQFKGKKLLDCSECEKFKHLVKRRKTK
jgi:hypothetical protein